MLNWRNMSLEEKLEFVSDCIARRMAAYAISTSIKGATRNAIIGFCNRRNLKLPGRPKTEKTEKPKRGKTRKRKRPGAMAPAKAAKPVAVQTPPAPPRLSIVEIEEFDESPIVLPIDDVGPISILDLPRIGRCRWPLIFSYRGLRADEMMFCGEATAAEEVYCAQCRPKSVHPRLVRTSIQRGKVEWHR